MIKSLYESVVICSGVYNEVVEKGWGLPGSMETDRAVHEGWIKVIDVVDKWKTKEIAKRYKIQMANAETIQLAPETKPDLFLADEEEIRRLAEKNSLKIRGCLGILINGVRKKLISISDAKKGVEELSASGYRMSNEILKAFRNILKSLERG